MKKGTKSSGNCIRGPEILWNEFTESENTVTNFRGHDMMNRMKRLSEAFGEIKYTIKRAGGYGIAQ